MHPISHFILYETGGGMSFNKWVQSLCALALASILPACVMVPKEQIADFVESVSATRDAGHEVYLALDRAVTASDGTEAASGVSCPRETLECFDPSDHLPRPSRAEMPEIEARLLTLDVVNTYTEVIFALASGASQSDLADKIDRYAAAASGTMRLAGGGGLTTVATDLLGPAAIGAVRSLGTTVEGLRASRTARTEIIAQSDDVSTLIEALIDDTSAAFTLYSGAQAQIAARSTGAARAEAIESIRAYHDSLAAYVVLLARTRDSHNALISALEADVPALERYETALEQALQLRTAAEAFKGAMAGVAN